MTYAQATARCWAEINLTNLEANYKTALSFLDGKALLIPVLKANAYGCGAKRVAQSLYSLGAKLFAVACLYEAEEIRKVVPDADILIMGLTGSAECEQAIEQDFLLTAYSPKSAGIISETARRIGVRARVHLKVDTGLHRLGFAPEQTDALIQCAHSPSLTIEGLYTHLALRNREEDDRQFAFLERAHQALSDSGLTVPMLHAGDSIGMVRYPHRHYDGIRAGAWLYGVCPYRYAHPEKCLEVLTVKTRISQIHEVKAGSCVGYDDEHPITRDSRIATLSAGYVDGFPRLNNAGEVLINGKRAPVLGLVCMDQMMVDVTEIPDAEEGGVATLLGSGISVDEYASVAKLNRNEALSRTGRRVPRVYLKNNEPCSIVLEME